MQIAISDPRVQMAARIMDYASNLSARQQELLNRFISTTLQRLPNSESSDAKIDNPQLVEQHLNKSFAERNARSDWNYQVWTYHFA